ncbi:hypothetical protein [Microcoleus sp. herbarium14]|uniref:hypothetical protein n=1 Tax=Microcoleus sp. herbarium14 TaxID=3055439 RepID=UPI002FD14677
MVKHNIASSGSAEILCQKLPCIADKLRHRKVRRTITLEAFVWRELRYIANDSGCGTIENYLKEMALDSLDAIEERRTGICAKTREPKT